MSDFDRFDGHFLCETSEDQLPRSLRLALVHGTETLLRDESEAWRQMHLPAFAAMAASLRRDTEQREQDARPHLELALRFDELATPPYETHARDDDEGPY